MPDNKGVETIETTAGQVADVLKRLGVASDRMIRVTIEPDDWLATSRRESRRLVVAAGLSDEEIDRLIDEVRNEVQPPPK